MNNESAVKGPWYRYFREELGKADGFIVAVNDSPGEVPQDTYATFEKETLAAFIFESNNLEKEGLPLGETRELVFTELENFPQAEAQILRRVDFTNFFGANLLGSLNTSKQLTEERDRIDKIHLSGNRNKAEIHVFYKSESKEARTVAQHLDAILNADEQFTQRRLDDLEVGLYWILKIKELRGISFDKIHYKKYLKLGTVRSLLNEDLVKNLHKIMADGLIKSSLAPAGEYRKHPVSTDMESHYPAPGDVPRAMEKFIEQFQALEQEYTNPIVLAAWASTQFVLIHPFSDFNGRMSRLIANMVLRSYGVPFWTSLRSTKKERGRYITALRHYRRDSPRSIATLIAKQVNYNFEEFNKILSLSGYEPIVPSPEFKDLSAEALETKKFLPYSEQAKQKYEAAVAKSQQ